MTIEIEKNKWQLISNRSANIFNIANMATSIDKVHESCYRSYHTLEAVKHWLRHEVPHVIILELLDDIDSQPNVRVGLDELDKIGEAEV